jgi:hypothetical protein
MGVNIFPPASGGTPGGNTAARPSSPTVGTTFYNGQKGYLEIYNGSAWLVASSVPGAPTISVADVGTSIAYGSAQANVTITAPTNGGAASGYTIAATLSSTSYTATSSTATTVNMTLGNGGTYNFSTAAANDFGTGQASIPQGALVTTIPQAPTIALSTVTSSSISFTVTGDNGGKAISNYQFSTDGTNYTALSPVQTTSPITISGLSPLTSYTINLKAVNANGVSTASNAVTTTTAWAYEYVVVGGGAGAGGYYYTGGGGSGSMRTGSADGVLATALTVSVGAGGAQQNGPGGAGNPGTQSRLGSIIAPGGRGETASATANFAGGSVATSTQGGGSGGNANSAADTSAGGGGAGAAGSPGSLNGTLTGNGGVGLSTSISGSSVFYAGGGGGSAFNGGTRGSGGNGGGGNGTTGNASLALGSAGGTNTGGGGGGASHPNAGAAYGYGFAGGSGRVMIKIPNTYTATFSGGVTQTMSTAVSGFKVYTVTVAGTSDTVTFS